MVPHQVITERSGRAESCLKRTWMEVNTLRAVWFSRWFFHFYLKPWALPIIDEDCLVVPKEKDHVHQIFRENERSLFTNSSQRISKATLWEGLKKLMSIQVPCKWEVYYAVTTQCKHSQKNRLHYHHCQCCGLACWSLIPSFTVSSYLS